MSSINVCRSKSSLICKTVPLQAIKIGNKLINPDKTGGEETLKKISMYKKKKKTRRNHENGRRTVCFYVHDYCYRCCLRQVHWTRINPLPRALRQRAREIIPTLRQGRGNSLDVVPKARGIGEMDRCPMSNSDKQRNFAPAGGDAYTRVYLQPYRHQQRLVLWNLDQ